MRKHHFVIENKSQVNENIHTFYLWDSHGMIHKSGLTAEKHATLEDEFIAYIYDSLLWLDTWNPSTGERCRGLNNYGITVIEEKDALLKLYQLICIWIDLHLLLIRSNLQGIIVLMEMNRGDIMRHTHITERN